MISEEIKRQYTATIGIECHVQLKTKTKLFSAVGNDAREAPVNSLISHIDLGMPGALPVLNKKALELATRVAFALNTKPQASSQFDRKQYFYPDLPMGYQITQFYHPIIKGGHVTILVDGKTKQIGITEAHLEADAGKSSHPVGKDYSLVDLNRAGTPLIEIVSEPDMHSPEEARLYAHELYLLMKFADVSLASLFYGNMRFDVNVSVSKQPGKLGTRSESKNLNSFKSVERAAEYEINRQIELLEKGQKVVQETRGWDDAKQKTFSQRSKEEANDYRYMPEPDIPPVKLTDEYINMVAADMPVMPDVWRSRLQPLKIQPSQIETLLQAEAEEGSVGYLGLVAELIQQPSAAKNLINWMVNVEIPLRHDKPQAALLPAKQRLQIYNDVASLVKVNKLSSTNAKALLAELLILEQPVADIEAYASQQGLIQQSDTGAIEAIVKQVLEANPQAVADLKEGQMKAIGFLVGQVMKQSKGQANPQMAQDIIKKAVGL